MKVKTDGSRKLAERLRAAAAQTTRVNAEVAILCELAISAAAKIDLLSKALDLACDTIVSDSSRISIIRLDEASAP